jgi:hypothetical protein
VIARLVVCCCLVAYAVLASAAESAESESDFYRLTTLAIPDGVVLEVGSLELLPDGRLAVSTRRGEIWLVSHPFADDSAERKWTRFAHGLHEVLGIAYRDGWLYITQRGDVSRLKDTNGDDVADVFEIVNDDWEVSGDYHEYAFGSKFDKEGNLWVMLCLTGSFSSQCKYRGWCVRITGDGKMIPTTSGIRSPGGIGPNAAGDMFYTDNQGPWNGTCGLKHLWPGKFVGHPGGFRWYDLPEAKAAMGRKPMEPQSKSRFLIEAAKIPEYVPPVVLFPYKKMGQSASGIACDLSLGKFGPFSEQLFVGDQTNSTVMRCYLEKIDGYYQGVCFPFREGFGSGTLALLQHGKSLFVGGTNRGWGSRGAKPFALERIDWTGKMPFEIHEMRAKPNGFELTFTEPVDPAAAGDVKSYALVTYTYPFQADYGGPEVDFTNPTIASAKVSPDRKSVRLIVEGLVAGHIHELHAAGVKSAAGLPLLHSEAYYTLNRIPKE